MTTDITVRALTQKDFADWRRLWSEYLSFYETTVPQEVYETTFSRLLSRALYDKLARLTPFIRYQRG